MKKNLEHLQVYNEAQTVHNGRDTNIWLKMGYERVLWVSTKDFGIYSKLSESKQQIFTI